MSTFRKSGVPIVIQSWLIEQAKAKRARRAARPNASNYAKGNVR